jgi:hypothetical protein
MKWGKRKTRSAKETRTIEKRKKVASKRRTLSDGDLKAYVERLEKEKKLKDLVDQDTAPGKTLAKKIASDSGQKVIRTVAAGGAMYALKVAIDRDFNVKEAAKYIAPKLKK